MKNALPRFRNCLKLTNLFFIALIAIACTQASANVNLASASDIQTAAKDSGPIKDDQGRIRYIVDLVDDFSDKPASFADAKSVVDYHTAKSGKLIDDVVKIHDIEIKGTTSLVGTSFTAYLTPKQFDQFSIDKRVKLITQDAYLTPSAIWNSTTDGSGQIRPWGLQALGVANAGGSNGTATVYVLDTGVEMHSDLPGLAAVDQLSAIPGISPTGCYPHATHVAGIIGAADNGFGVVGVLPGVRLVSIAVGDSNSGSCSNGFPVSGFVQGLEIIYQKLIQNSSVGIVNISFNFAAYFSSTGTIGQKMKVVATPANYFFGQYFYKGAFIVQSAGNDFANACSYAYDLPHPSDGIMVVGGLDDNGQRVIDPNGLKGYPNLPFAGDDNGSNFGTCVDVWAPSKLVRSTWSGGSYAVLSGTSMAAPHVAGFAARILESNPGIQTSVDLETAVRVRFIFINGSNLVMPNLTNAAVNAAPTIEIAEGLNRAPASGNLFNKLANNPNGSAAIDLRFQAVGASNCTVVTSYYDAPYNYWYTVGSQSFSSQSLQSSVPLNASSLQPGQYRWTISCTSPQGVGNTATADGYIKQYVIPHWFANTTSTGGGWQEISNGASVSWSISANATFGQYLQAYGADSCRVLSYGYIGTPFGDQVDNPNFNPSFSFVQTSLWVSPVLPTYNQFTPFVIGDPHTSAYGSFDGFKWLLTCWNADGVSNKTVMYGVGSP